MWFGHAHTVTWFHTEMPKNMNTHAYDSSGWCWAECQIACTLKPPTHCLDLALGHLGNPSKSVKKYSDLCHLSSTSSAAGQLADAEAVATPNVVAAEDTSPAPAAALDPATAETAEIAAFWKRLGSGRARENVGVVLRSEKRFGVKTDLAIVTRWYRNFMRHIAIDGGAGVRAERDGEHRVDEPTPREA